MPESLNVIALISGGKDSFFSILHCIQNGHRVIALANLYPPKPRSDHALDEADTREALSAQDMDSFMYQTVGHTVIPLYAECLNLPLYRQEIVGSTVNHEKDYYQSLRDVSAADNDIADHDETESLIPLLQRVRGHHPEANAVCSGAILSTYQRTRIESICLSLNLCPLSYLWQYPSLPPPSPSSLLDDLAAATYDVRIIKVASGGLDESLLGCNLMDQRTRNKLRKSVARFGGSELGEGGEYETIVIDGPAPLWRRRILWNPDFYIERSSGGTAYLSFDVDHLKTTEKDTGFAQSPWPFRMIGIWDDTFDKLKVAWDQKAYIMIAANTNLKKADSSCIRSIEITETSFKVGSLMYVTNMYSTNASYTAAEQMDEIIARLLRKLLSLGRTADDLVFSMILLDSLEQNFTEVNSAYATMFRAPNPAARVTIGTSLPAGVKVVLSVVCDIKPSGSRHGLHVQSRSYWAPANIGPYSQAITVKCGSASSLVYIAGQIPLVPASMLLLESSDTQEADCENADYAFCERCCLSLQHLWRIGTEMDVKWWVGAVAFVTGSEPDTQHKAATIAKTWQLAHDRSRLRDTDSETDSTSDDGKTFDVWHSKNTMQSTYVRDTTTQTSLKLDPSFLSPTSSHTALPPCLIVQVDTLPRASDIEWQSMGFIANDICFSSSATPLTTTDHQASSQFTATRCTCASNNVGFAFIAFSATTDIRGSIREAIEWILPSKSSTDLSNMSSYHTTLYIPHSAASLHIEIADTIPVGTTIPCHSVWNGNGEELCLGIVVHFSNIESEREEDE